MAHIIVLPFEKHLELDNVDQRAFIFFSKMFLQKYHTSLG